MSPPPSSVAGKPPPRPAGPPPRNLITPQGNDAMRAEIKALRAVERPKVVEAVSRAAANGDRSENGDYIYGKKKLREIDRRIRFLSKRLETAEVVDPRAQKIRNRVYFGATVTYANSRDDEITVTIVGQDEADLTRGTISWLSPVARALMKAAVGDEVRVSTPAGDDILEVLGISYPE